MDVSMESFIDAGPTPLLASCWQRILAFTVDLLLVVALTTVVGFALAPVWKMAGEWSRLAGLGVGMLYFGFADRLGPRIIHFAARVARLVVVILGKMLSFALAQAWKILDKLASLLGLKKFRFIFVFVGGFGDSVTRFQSRIANLDMSVELNWQRGQSLGMHLTNCKVVQLDGRHLSWYRAMLRFLVFAGLFASLGSRGSGNAQIDSLIAGAAAGLFAITIYLLMFNRVNRRGLHDLLVGSVVINEEFSAPTDLGKTWRWHYLFVVFAFLVGFGAASNSVQQQGQSISMQPELVTELATAFPGEKFQAFVQTSKREVDGEERESEYLVISINNPVEQRDLARAVEYVIIARDTMPTSGLMRRVVVRYVDQFHVGFSFSQKVESFVYPPAEWERLIDSEDREAAIAEIMAEREKKEKKNQGGPDGN